MPAVNDIAETVAMLQSARDKLARMAKRGYSHDFPVDTSRRVKIEIDKVPPSLAVSLKAKCKREGVSIRALTLRLWKEWVSSPEVQQP